MRSPASRRVSSRWSSCPGVSSPANAAHALSRDRLAAEFAPAEFIRRPPRSLVAIATELRLTTIGWGLMCVIGFGVGVAFVGMGTEVFIGERGQFSGAGITTGWPAR